LISENSVQAIVSQLGSRCCMYEATAANANHDRSFEDNPVHWISEVPQALQAHEPSRWMGKTPLVFPIRSIPGFRCAAPSAPARIGLLVRGKDATTLCEPAPTQKPPPWLIFHNASTRRNPLPGYFLRPNPNGPQPHHFKTNQGAGVWVFHFATTWIAENRGRELI